MHTLLPFFGVDLLLVCTPGPDWLYIVARGLGQGRRAGLTAVAGICSAYVLYTVLTTAGLAAALRALPAALPALRYAGAAYLVFLAVRTLATLRRGGPAPPPPPPQPPAVILRQSAVTALLNPKALLLYLSLMPQFVVSGSAVPVGLQIAVLGCLHVLDCACGYGVVAIAASRAGKALSATPWAARRMTAVSATLLLGVAAVTLSAH